MASAGSTFTTPQDFKPLGTFTYLSTNIPSQPGVDDVIFISVSVPAGKTWNIYRVALDSGVQCRCKIYHGLNPIASFRNGSAQPFGEYKFDLPYAIPATETLTVLVDFVDGFPVQEIGAYVQLTEN